ncbi:MAG: NAD(P)/FAD-dependent oxidoreductase, partial [Acidobacteriota bacterium]|nr:NAD(P)/FAD-dependent oxidoreductase [Acidobacteriota bacterium]
MSKRALVVGAGPNGLAAAIRLAQSGIETTVLEARPLPGGAVRSEELTLPGFRHDTFSSVYPAAAASPVFGRLPLAEHGLEWVHPELCMAHPLEDGRAVGLYRELEPTVDSLEQQHAGDGRAWARFVGPYLRNFEAVRATMLAGFPPVGGPLRLLTQAGPLAAARLGLLVALPASTLARQLFRAPGSRAWLLGAAAHGDAPVSSGGSAIAAVYLHLLGHAVGWPSPRGGAQALTDALVAELRAQGGELVCDAPVARVESRAGRVTGVTLVDGSHHWASVVLADVMPRALLEMTGDALRGWYRAGLLRFRQGPATLKLDWALDGPIPWTAAAARGAGTVHVGGGEPATLSSLSDSRDGLAPRPFLLVGQQSLADPSRAPDGKHTAWA